MMSRHIEISSEKDCCGCSACGAVCPKECISFHKDSLGFLYPEVDTTLCIECGACQRVCPFINPKEEFAPQECFAAVNLDSEERRLSSSGGVFIALARRTIRSGGVVYGAVFRDDWSVEHTGAETLEEVLPMMTSKYLQSRMGECFADTRLKLEAGRQVLFTGTPCQIAGLKHFLRKDYPNLLAVEVICHGVPAPGVWHNYLDETFARPKGGHVGKNTVLPLPNKNCEMPAIAGISFRDKRLGWKKFGFALFPLASGLGGEENSVSPSKHFFETFGQNLYMQAFLWDWSLRPSCFDCKSKSGRSHADITLGDFWRVDAWDGYTDDDKGTSCIICRTARGCETVSQLHGEVSITPAPYDVILAGNQALELSAIETNKAVAFRRLFPIYGLHTTMKKLTYRPLWRRAASYLKRKAIIVLTNRRQKK